MTYLHGLGVLVVLGAFVYWLIERHDQTMTMHKEFAVQFAALVGFLLMWSPAVVMPVFGLGYLYGRLDEKKVP